MPEPSTSKFRLATGYVLMLVGAVLLFFLIRWHGESLTAPEPAAEAEHFNAADDAQQGHPLLQVLLALAVVVVCGQALGKLFSLVGQPPVIGEVVAGILLGPSLLGQEVSGWILPPAVAPQLQVIAQLGIILYMFLVGLELNAGLLRAKAHAAVAVSQASIVLPFVLGAALAIYLYPKLSSSDVPFTAFSLFLGASMSVTAFPVLARILTDRRMSKTPLGVMALACAATDDVTAWCLLALVVGVAKAQVDGAVLIVVLTLSYMAAMFFVVRPVIKWLMAPQSDRLSSPLAPREETLQLAKRQGDLPDRPLPVGLVAAAFIGLLLSALATEAIGIHAIFGAFLAGAVVPHDSQLARQLTHKLEDVVTVLLLPAFFAFTGMRTEIGLVSGVRAWLICGLIILVATAGKFGGTLVAARLTGSSWKDASALGVLMNTRGLMELIVLNIGLDLKVISPTLFAMMVLMALVTTLATTPILQLLRLDTAAK